MYCTLVQSNVSITDDCNGFLHATVACGMQMIVSIVAVALIEVCYKLLAFTRQVAFVINNHLY